MIHWIYLILAGLFEVDVTYCLAKLKDVAGFELAGWSMALLCGMGIIHSTWSFIRPMDMDFGNVE